MDFTKNDCTKTISGKVTKFYWKTIEIVTVENSSKGEIASEIAFKEDIANNKHCLLNNVDSMKSIQKNS